MAGKSRVAATNSQKGFSLIEVLVVSGLSTMLLLTVSALFMTFLAGSASTNISRSLSREGDSSLNQLEYLIRNAYSVSCPNPNTVRVVSEENVVSVISIQNSRLQIVDEDPNAAASEPAPRYLTSSNVRASGTLDCTPAGAKQYIDISLTLEKMEGGSPVGSETFSTSVQARN